MAAKKSSRRKPAKATRKASSPKLSKRKATKKTAAKKSVQVKTAKKTAPRARKAAVVTRSKPRTVKAPLPRETTPPEELLLESTGQAGDLQGLSSIEDANAESVDELLEEGNAFEAGVVKGVEDAADRAEKGVRTHEVPEDDVP